MNSDILCDLLASIEAGDLPNLPEVRAFERHGIVANLAAMIAVLHHYSERSPPWGADDWRSEYAAQIGDVAPFQRPGAGGAPIEPAEVSASLPGDLHVMKLGRRGHLELLLGLIATTLRPYCGVGTATGSRAGAVMVIPTDGRLDHEIMTLAKAMPVTGGASARDHLLWTFPAGTTPLTSTDATPISDVALAIRMDRDGPRKINTKTAVKAAPPDPQVPLRIDATGVGPMRAGDKSPWRYKLVLGALADGVEVSGAAVSRAAPILATDHGMPAVRIAVLQTGQGKTTGFREIILPVPTAAARTFQLAGSGVSDVPAEVAKAIIAEVANAQNRMAQVLWEIEGRPDRGSPGDDRRWAASQAFGSEAGMTLASIFPTILASDRRIDTTPVASAHFERAASACSDPLRLARARLKFEDFFMADHKSLSPQPDLARRAYGTIQHWARTLTPSERAQLRGGAEPMAIWRCLASIPDAELTATEGIWRAAIRHIASAGVGQLGAGRALYRAGYPEPRLRALLANRGPGHVAEALAWLASTETKCDPTTLVTLALADALNDPAARRWAVRRIAIDYVRSPTKASAETEPEKSEETENA